MPLFGGGMSLHDRVAAQAAREAEAARKLAKIREGLASTRRTIETRQKVLSGVVLLGLVQRQVITTDQYVAWVREILGPNTNDAKFLLEFFRNGASQDDAGAEKTA